jgi:effector-binding domain-containing protein
MAITPRVVKRGVTRYAGIREQARRDKLADVVSRRLPGLFQFLQQHQIPPVGAPLIRYVVVDYNTGNLEIDIGVPVKAGTLPASDHIRAAEIPDGRFATIIHRGPYAGLVDTTAQLLDWAKREKVTWAVVEQGDLTRWQARVEHYLAGPPLEHNPAHWKTEVAILLAGNDAAA